MNSVRPSGFRLCAALALSILLSVGSTQLSAGPLTDGQVPTITISIEDVPNPPKWSWTPSTNDFRRATDADGGYELVGQREFDILTNRAHVSIQELRFDPDPFVLNNILVTNTTTTTQIFSAFVGLPTTFAAPNLISGDVRTSVIDGGNDGATVTSVSGQPIYQAQIDFATVASLQNDPFTLVAPAGGSNTAAALFGPSVSAVPVTSSIGIQLRFTVTPGDTVAILSRFDVDPVPEPSSAAFVGLALALIARRRR